ncbi:MAG: ABC transporter ATP-binding protein [Actinomycetota bacterium]|nr:ABC transporter ATP-binding protein [Actinomycetota bacterium]
MTTRSLALSGTTRRNGFILGMNLELTAGETIAVLGPNGAGKTTLLRLVAGLERLDDGTLEIAGLIVDDSTSFKAPHQRPIGWVPQDRLVFDHLTVSANVGFSPRATPERVTTLLAALDLGELANRSAGECSGGQAQRIAVARALAADPTLLLLDEPSAALDVESRHLIHQALAADGRPAALLVTHDPVEAATLADRIVILEDGRVTQEGTPAEIRSQPDTRYAASLAGLNFVDAYARGTTATTDAGAGVVLAEPAVGPVHVVIPPSAVALHTTRPGGSPRNVWQATVAELSPAFDRVRVALDGPLPLVAEITRDAVDRLGLRPGSRVWAAVKATEVTAHTA